MNLTAIQLKFAKEVVLNGGDKVAAFKVAGWKWDKYSKPALAVEADKMFNLPKISLKIKELQAKADKIANESFTISVKQRLEWLKEITEAGLSTYVDATGNKRREGLTASRSAIETMNTMLGVGDDTSEGAEALNITFQVSPAVKEIKVVNAKS